MARVGRRRIKAVLSAVVVMQIASSVAANDESVDRRIPYQGKLTGVTGTATLVLELWDAPSGGARVWGPESQQVTPDSNGNFAIVIGGSSLDRCARQLNETLLCNGTGDGRADLDQITPGALYVQVAVSQNSTTTNLTPRQQLFPAFHADVADTVVDGAVTAVKLADSGVTTAKIADLGITTPKLALGAVTTPTLGDGAVVNQKIQDGTIAREKLAINALEAGGSDRFITHFARLAFFGGNPSINANDSSWINSIQFDGSTSAWRLDVTGSFNGQISPVCTIGMERGGAVWNVDLITASAALIYIAPRGAVVGGGAPAALPANGYNLYVTLICIGGKP